MKGLFKKCTRKLTETSSQESKRIEIMNGNSIQMPTFSDMVKREQKMELLWPYMPSDTKINSQKPQSSKRLLKTIRQQPKIFLDNQRTQVRVKLIGDPISFMVLRMFKVPIHGMPPDVFMVNQMPEKFYQTMTLENQSSQTVEMSSETKKTKSDHSDAQPSEKTFHTRNSEVLLTIKTTVMNQRLLTFYSHQITQKQELENKISGSQDLGMK